MKNVVARLVEHAAELGLPLNLGGGIAAGDALEEFKRGFANRQEPWRTSEIVCDPAAYERLSAGRDAGRFLPRLPGALAALGGTQLAGSAGVGPVNGKASAGSPPYLPQVALPKARIASSVAAPL